MSALHKFAMPPARRAISSLAITHPTRRPPNPITLVNKLTATTLPGDAAGSLRSGAVAECLDSDTITASERHREGYEDAGTRKRYDTRLGYVGASGNLFDKRRICVRTPHSRI